MHISRIWEELMGWESLLLINNLDPMHSVDQEINKVNVVSFCGLRVFFLFLNIEGDLYFYVNKLKHFLVLYICVVKWDGS